MPQEKSRPINFTFCARCGEQMKPHDASAERCGACYRPIADCLCKDDTNKQVEELKRKLAITRKALQAIARNECGNLYPGEVATDALFEAA